MAIVTQNSFLRHNTLGLLCRTSTVHPEIIDIDETKWCLDHGALYDSVYIYILKITLYSYFKKIEVWKIILYSSVDKWYGLGMHATNVEVYSDDFAFIAKWSSIFCSINPTRV